ncbi:hypothetical protein RDABS01_030607 [Bienertia sinuspersici]
MKPKILISWQHFE